GERGGVAGAQPGVVTLVARRGTGAAGRRIRCRACFRELASALFEQFALALGLLALAPDLGQLALALGLLLGTAALLLCLLLALALGEVDLLLPALFLLQPGLFLGRVRRGFGHDLVLVDGVRLRDGLLRRRLGRHRGILRARF